MQPHIGKFTSIKVSSVFRQYIFILFIFFFQPVWRAKIAYHSFLNCIATLTTHGHFCSIANNIDVKL